MISLLISELRVAHWVGCPPAVGDIGDRQVLGRSGHSRNRLIQAAMLRLAVFQGVIRGDGSFYGRRTYPLDSLLLPKLERPAVSPIFT